MLWFSLGYLGIEVLKLGPGTYICMSVEMRLTYNIVEKAVCDLLWGFPINIVKH